MTKATVTQASPLLVRLDGASTAVAALKLTSYTPAAGDRVAVSQLDTSLLVIGKVG